MAFFSDPWWLGLTPREIRRARMLMGTHIGDRRGGRVCVFIDRKAAVVGSVSERDYELRRLAADMKESVLDWSRRR